MSLLHQELGVLPIGIPPLRLDVGGHRATHVGTLVVVQMALGQGAVNYLCGALHLAGLVGVLNAQDERALAVPGDEPGVQGGAQVAHVHIAGGRGGEAGADLPLGDLGFHLLKICHVQCHTVSLHPGAVRRFFLV